MLLICTGLIFVGYDIVVPEAQLFADVGLSYSKILFLSPIMFSVIVYLIMTLRLGAKVPNRAMKAKNRHLLLRIGLVLLANLLWGTVSIIYHNHYLAEVVIPKNEQGLNYAHELKAQLDFPFVEMSDGSKQKIVYPTASGRKELIEAILTKNNVISAQSVSI